MVESGDICAKVDSPAGTVHFQEEDMHVSSSATVASRLEADLQTTADLTERVRKLEARLMINAVFIQKVCLLRAGFHTTDGAVAAVTLRPCLCLRSVLHVRIVCNRRKFAPLSL